MDEYLKNVAIAVKHVAKLDRENVMPALSVIIDQVALTLGITSAQLIDRLVEQKPIFEEVAAEMGTAGLFK